ncbi:MAG: MmcQ/YjbR family DNA-binding protein [Flavobacteriaceae bacterium]|jgi:predicted DNA-binding protein (MmcQ/YjbR family)|nr:MmcQ/YjbR family DNA-binding protein [Flavobacteriaceae bacterium]CAI8152191.1 MAG: Uncharacterised protein [Formosa sp. Hel3_A1_48]
MTIEDIRLFCLQKPKTTEEFPFDQDTLVFKVLGKIFALCPLSQWERGAASITLKCDPEYALELRSEFDSILPGFHANKKHWNTIQLDTNELSPKFILELITHSYEMVVNNMSKKQRKELGFEQ